MRSVFSFTLAVLAFSPSHARDVSKDCAAVISDVTAITAAIREAENTAYMIGDHSGLVGVDPEIIHKMDQIAVTSEAAEDAIASFLSALHDLCAVATAPRS